MRVTWNYSWDQIPTFIYIHAASELSAKSPCQINQQADGGASREGPKLHIHTMKLYVYDGVKRGRKSMTKKGLTALF